MPFLKDQVFGSSMSGFLFFFALSCFEFIALFGRVWGADPDSQSDRKC